MNQMDQVICTVDVVLLTLHEQQLKVLLLRREQEPYAGAWALPGGFIRHDDADARAAALRVLQQKAQLQPPYLEQLASFSGAQRDPRGWSVSIVYYALVASPLLQACQTDHTALHALDQLPPLPFDHQTIIAATSARLRSKSQYSSLPCHLLDQQFTLPQLQKVYEVVIGEALNKSEFRRKIAEMDALEELPGQQLKTGAHRPAQLYRLKPEWRDQLNLRPRGI